MQENFQSISFQQFKILFFSNNDPGAAGFGDVNISAILNSFQMGYDKRVRPNYGGKLDASYPGKLFIQKQIKF